jgi:hypothetical protein
MKTYWTLQVQPHAFFNFVIRWTGDDEEWEDLERDGWKMLKRICAGDEGSKMATKGFGQ